MKKELIKTILLIIGYIALLVVCLSSGGCAQVGLVIVNSPALVKVKKPVSVEVDPAVRVDQSQGKTEENGLVNDMNL